LAVDSEIGVELDHYWYKYSNREPISLTFFSVKLLQSPEFLEHTESAWVKPADLTSYDLMNGDMQFVATRYALTTEHDRLTQERDALRAFAQDAASFMWSMDCESHSRVYLAGVFERHGLIAEALNKKLEPTPLLTGEAIGAAKDPA